jgi:F-type H+-transporting ATPase subunit b
MNIGHQLGELLLRSIPTIILLLVTLGLYRALVYTPLSRILAERYRRTEGALEQAREDIAAAEARTAEYENRLREARLAIFKAQEHRRELAVQARYAAVAEARQAAEARIGEERKRLESEKETAKAGLQQRAEELAAEIILVLLSPAGVSQRSAQSPAGGPS